MIYKDNVRQRRLYSRADQTTIKCNTTEVKIQQNKITKPKKNHAENREENQV